MVGHARLNNKHITYDSIEKVSTAYDYIYSIDVLEHIENDTEILSKLHTLVKEKGKVFLYVPARMELYSDFDRKIGHYRRYTRQELIKKPKEAGFKIQTVYYHEFLGYLSVLLSNRLSSGGNLNPVMVRMYDKLIVPTANLFERIIHPPVGKSLVAVLQKQ